MGAPAETRIGAALKVIREYAGIDGAHHKQWLIDQVVQSLLGDDESYRQWIRDWEHGDYGPKTYEWDTGSAP